MNHLIEDLRYDDVFMLYKLVKKDGRMTKPPFTTRHTYADKTNPKDWASYDDVVDTLKRFGGSYAGKGAALKPDMMKTFVDFDKCIENGKIINPSVALFVECANTYFELSPSGTGLHGHFNNETPFDPERKRHNDGKFGYEVYTKDAYHTITEKPFGESKPVRTISNNDLIELLKIVGFPWDKKQEEAAKAKANEAVEADGVDFYDVGLPDADVWTQKNITWNYHNDDDLLKMMFASKYGDDIKSAWNGTLKDNRSENDYALIKHLAYWTKHDKQRSKLMFLSSPLGERDKAKREDYFERTWDAAIKALAGKKFEFTPRPPATTAPKPDTVKTSQDEGVKINVTRESAFDDLLLDAYQNSAGYGDIFAVKHKRDAIFEPISGAWMVFADGHWQYDEIMHCKRLMRDIAKQRFLAAEKITDLDKRKKFVIKTIDAQVPKFIDESLRAASSVLGMQRSIKHFDTDKMLACAGEYTLDLSQCIARQSAREDYLTLRLGANFVKGADCPRWKQNLREIFRNDDELISFVKRALGYCLTGKIDVTKIFLLVGDGANGKSLFLKIVARVFGDYATSMPFSVFDVSERGNTQQELFNAKGKRFISVIETNQDRRLDEALVKSLTGNDEVTGRKLFCEPVKFFPQFKIWLAMNHKPHILGRDHGIWRRICLIPFNENFTDREEKGLEDTLLGELSGILNWMLEGLVEYYEHGLKEPKTIAEAVKQYRAEEDVLQQWMSDCTEPNPLGQVQAKPAFQSFITWAQGANIKTNISMMRFSLMMSKSGFETSLLNGRKHFKGFTISAS